VARTGRPATRQVGAVQRAIAILNELAAARTELGTNEIARRTGINVSTISRILATLAGGGLVDHVASTGRYRIGVGIVRLASAVDLDIRSLARPHLEELTRRLGETATLSVPGEHEAATLDFVQSPHTVRSVAEVGRTSAAHATAVGKVLLAHGGTLPGGRLKAYTERTIVGASGRRAGGGLERGCGAGARPRQETRGDPRGAGPRGPVQPPGDAHCRRNTERAGRPDLRGTVKPAVDRRAGAGVAPSSPTPPPADPADRTGQDLGRAFSGS